MLWNFGMEVEVHRWDWDGLSVRGERKWKGEAMSVLKGDRIWKEWLEV